MSAAENWREMSRLKDLIADIDIKECDRTIEQTMEAMHDMTIREIASDFYIIAQHVKDIKLAYEKEVLNDKNNESIF